VSAKARRRWAGAEASALAKATTLSSKAATLTSALAKAATLPSISRAAALELRPKWIVAHSMVTLGLHTTRTSKLRTAEATWLDPKAAAEAATSTSRGLAAEARHAVATLAKRALATKRAALVFKATLIFKATTIVAKSTTSFAVHSLSTTRSATAAEWIQRIRTAKAM